MSTGVRVVLVSAPDRETGERLGRTLVEEGRAACANVLPGATSIFRWRGAVEQTEEALVILKAPVTAVPGLVARTAELHPYEVPEVLAVPVEEGYGPYLSWVMTMGLAEGEAAS